jgi:transposase
MPNHPVPALPFTDDQRDVLTTWSRSRALPQRQLLRAHIILLAAEGVASRSIAARLGCSRPTVQLWRRRLCEADIGGHEEDAPGCGRPATYDERTVTTILSVTMGRPPKGETDGAAALWLSVSALAQAPRLVWRDHDLLPHLGASS